MSDLLIRGLSPETVARLKQQAAHNSRSMQAEAKAIVEAGIKPSLAEWLERVDRTRQEIESESGRLDGSSAEIVRDMRDRRSGSLGGEK